MSQQISIVVVDDHPIFRAGLVQSLATEPGLAVQAQGGSAADAIALVGEHRPDILLLDLWMQQTSSIGTIPRIVAASPSTNVIVLTASEDGQDVSRALEAGAAGYVIKETTSDALIGVLRAVHGGETYISNTSLGKLLALHKGQSRQMSLLSKFSQLTPHETNVLRLVAQGLNNGEVGERLGIKDNTVKYHLTSIFTKLGCRNRVEAAILARQVWPEITANAASKTT